jgi:hypothetical protein
MHVFLFDSIKSPKYRKVRGENWNLHNLHHIIIWKVPSIWTWWCPYSLQHLGLVFLTFTWKGSVSQSSDWVENTIEGINFRGNGDACKKHNYHRAALLVQVSIVQRLVICTFSLCIFGNDCENWRVNFMHHARCFVKLRQYLVNCFNLIWTSDIMVAQ